MTTITEAAKALDRWDPDQADADIIGQVFRAIYERAPDADEDAVSLIYAARDVLGAREARRLLDALA